MEINRYHKKLTANMIAVNKHKKKLSVNGHTQVQETMRHDTLDKFAKLFCKLKNEGQFIPAFFKVDIDAAFRRIPIHPNHRWACGIAYRDRDEVLFCCSHLYMNSVYVRGVVVRALCMSVRRYSVGTRVGESRSRDL